MYYSKSIFTVFLLISSLCCKAQKSVEHTSEHAEYLKGVALYNEKSYYAASTFFEKALANQKTENHYTESASFYNAICAIKLGKKYGEEKLMSFVKNYPTSRYKNTAYLEAGNYYYNHGKPATSLQWFEKASTKYLTSSEEESYNFKMGYALFSNKKYTEAKRYLLALTQSKNYQTEANYYYGYICYVQEDYTTAMRYFDRLEGDNRYEKEILYYKMNMQFQKKDFDGVIAAGEKLLKIASRKQLSEISKIMGESYFYLENYEKAIPHLKKYKGRKNKLTTKDHYFLGYAYYKLKDYDNAILTFNRIVTGKDEVAQNAYYHLAMCYLESDKKSEALNAFKNSSEMTFDNEIKEDAGYNYAKLSYAIGNPYMSSALILQEFVSTYPNSRHTAEINTLIIDSYLQNNDYVGALDYYANKHLYKNSTFYKVSLYRGMQLFQSAKYQEAIPFFKTCSNQLIAPETQAIALYWKAESAYLLQDYKSSLTDFNRFKKHPKAKKTEAYKNIYYAMGYSYFKLKDYEKSLSSFKNYTQSKNTTTLKKNDAYVRMGDCSFISKSYWNAMEYYNKVIAKKGIDADYAAYQKGISYGFVRRNEKKITSLAAFAKNHPKSSYKDDALYELGKAYIAAKENNKAIDTFEQLIATYATSVYAPKVMLKQGLLYFNENNAEKALKKYKSVVSNYPKSKEAQQAVQNARQVYVDIDKVDDYAAWIKDIGYTNFSNTDLDNAMYEAATLKYQANKLPEAVASFKKYLINFPEGLHVLKVNFYSAQANFSLGNSEKSIEGYRFVIAQNTTEYTEQSLSRLSQIYLEKNDWKAATPILKRLELEANFPQNILFAQSNLMKAMFEAADYETTIAYAEKVLNTEKADKQVQSDASIFIARASMKTNNLEKAKTAYNDVSEVATGILKAEALYYEAYFNHLEKAYDASNKTIQILASEYASYKYWGIKGLILMAKNNHKLNDAFQATYILENIIENYEQYDDLQEEAKTYLAVIKEENSKEEAEEITEEEEEEATENIEF